MVTKFFNISTDGTLSENSNILVPSQKAVRNFIASKSIQLDYMQSTQPSTASNGDKWLNTSNNLLYTYNNSWDIGILIEKDQFFTFNDLLYYYDGSEIKNYSTLSITEQNHGNQIKLWVGTREEYDDLDSDEIDPNTIYRISDESDVYAVLATQTQFDNNSQTTAATPYQVNQKFGNYLPLSGGNLDAGAVLRLTNTNSEVTALAFNTSGQLTISSNIYGASQLDINSIVVRSGNIYKTNTSGATALWSDSNISSTQLPTASTTDLGAVKIDGTTITINNGVISASGTSALANSASGTNSLTILGTSATNNGAVNIGNLSSSGANSAALGTNANALTNSVAIGSSNTSTDKTEANATGAIAIGYNAKANANNAIQIGTGANNTADTVQIKGVQLLDNNGKIVNDRLDATYLTNLIESIVNTKVVNMLKTMNWASAVTFGVSSQQTYTIPSDGYIYYPVASTATPANISIAGKSIGLNANIPISVKSGVVIRGGSQYSLLFIPQV